MYKPMSKASTFGGKLRGAAQAAKPTPFKKKKKKGNPFGGKKAKRYKRSS